VGRKGSIQCVGRKGSTFEEKRELMIGGKKEEVEGDRREEKKVKRGSKKVKQ
jgi:hypothetical protein